MICFVNLTIYKVVRRALEVCRTKRLHEGEIAGAYQGHQSVTPIPLSMWP
jgi:hypothetical protein